MKAMEGRLLIVDDMPENIMVLLDFLSTSGFKVLIAQGGKQAIQTVKYGKPELILLDIMMPDMNGFETCEKLKEDVETRDIPVIFMTALTNTEEKIRGFNLGAADYITKPFQHEEVLARIKTHLNLRRLQLALETQNTQLQTEIEKHKNTQISLAKAAGLLKQRTHELESLNAQLQQEVHHRRQIEIALRRANRELKRLANLDGLTQVANRRCLDSYLSNIWQQLGHEHLPLSLVLCDIDYFKNYNDCYGHQAGDDCLKRVAQGIVDAVNLSHHRPEHLVARYGGEEFVMVLPYTNEEETLDIANAIRTGISQLKILHKRSQVSQYVTLSMGIATMIPELHFFPTRLVAWADDALYQAKARGRNCVVVKPLKSIS